MKAVTVEQALTLWNRVKPLDKKIHMPLDAALGYVVSKDIEAGTDVPAFHKSAMDGYALIYDPTCRDYIVNGVIGAGEVWPHLVEPGHAVRIMTGAPVPQSCDTVVMQEQVKLLETPDCHIVDNQQPISIDKSALAHDDNKPVITIGGNIQKGSHIIFRGEDCTACSVVLPKGTRITSEVQTMLTGLGHVQVPVYAKPKVLLLTSGKEVVPPGTVLQEGQIYNSNRIMLEGLLRRLAIDSIVHYHVSDDIRLLDQEIAKVTELAKNVDVIISSGGVSVGLFDTIPEIYKSLGAEVLYNRIQMRPGAASYGAITPQNQLIFGLSGNPGAAYNGFHLLVAPIVKRIMGLNKWNHDELLCKMDMTINKQNPFDRYIQGQVEFTDGRPVFIPNTQFNSSSMMGLYKVNGLAKIPRGMHSVASDMEVSVIML